MSSTPAPYAAALARVRVRWRASPFTRWFLLVSLAGTLLIAFEPRLAVHLGLEEGQGLILSRFHTLLTYALVLPGLSYWALNSLSIAVLGLVLEHRFTSRRYILIATFGVAVGGLAILFLYPATRLYVGSAPLIHTLVGVAAAQVVKAPRTFAKSEYLAVAGITLVAFVPPPPTVIAYLTSWLVGAGSAWRRPTGQSPADVSSARAA